MTRLRTWLYVGPSVALAGLILFTVFAPRARAAIEALQEPDRSPPTHILIECRPGQPCGARGRPLGKTACDLDAASLANTLPKGSRVSCERVKR